MHSILKRNFNYINNKTKINDSRVIMYKLIFQLIYQNILYNFHSILLNYLEFQP